MSTFTEFNGPQGSNIRASDLLSLTQAYQSMLAQLQAHIAENPANNDVHTVRTFVNNLLADYTKLSDLVIRLNNYYTKTDADAQFATKTELAQKANAFAIPDITGKADKTELTAYVKKTELEAMAVITTIQSNITALQNALSGLNGTDTAFNWTGLISATDVIAGIIKANIFETNFRQIPAYVGGSDTDGVYYIFCELTKEAGTVYCEFHDDHYMSAVVEYAMRTTADDTIAALSVTCANKELTGLRFLVVEGTDANGVKRRYLAVRADEWVSTFTSLDGVGYHKTLTFTVAGINILIDGDRFYHKPNGACVVLAQASAGTGFSANALATDEFKATDNKTIFKVIRDGGLIHLVLADENFAAIFVKSRPYLTGSDGSKSPFLTAADVNAIDEVGVIRSWPKYEERGSGLTAVRIAVDIPGIDLATDGSTFDPEDYPELYAKLGTNQLPLIDYGIIKAKSLLEIIDSHNVAGGTLADAVATIHDTEVYSSVNDLPTTAATGALAIVRREGLYFVYEKTDTGWEIKS